MAQASPQAVPASGGRRPGEGWRVRAADRAEGARQPATRQPAPQDPDRRWADPRQANQAMDLLQTRRSQDQAPKEADAESVAEPRPGVRREPVPLGDPGSQELGWLIRVDRK